MNILNQINDFLSRPAFVLQITEEVEDEKPKQVTNNYTKSLIDTKCKLIE